MHKENVLLLAVPLFVLLLINSGNKYDFPLASYFNSALKLMSKAFRPVMLLNSSDGDEMKIVGKGSYTELNGTSVSFDIDASQMKKASAKGNMIFKSSYLEFKGNVDCLHLVEGKMIVSGTMRHISKGSLDWVFVGIRYQFTFEDSGNNLAADRMSGISIGGPPDCNTAVNLATPNEIKGNIQIIRYRSL